MPVLQFISPLRDKPYQAQKLAREYFYSVRGFLPQGNLISFAYTEYPWNKANILFHLNRYFQAAREKEITSREPSLSCDIHSLPSTNAYSLLSERNRTRYIETRKDQTTSMKLPFDKGDYLSYGNWSSSRYLCSPASQT